MSSHVIRKSISIKAQPAQVWDALTDPEKTKQYFFNCRVLSDWKVGSGITFKGKMFFIFNIEMQGKILDIEPGRLLRYSLKNGNADTGNSSTVTDTLNYHDGETILSITDDVGNAPGAEKRLKRSDKGWDKILSGLKKFVESQSAA